MAQVRITHQDGTVDEITTSGATQQIQVQQGDKIEVVNAALTSATVDGNNYVVTMLDESGATVQITFVDLFLLLATGDPQTTAADATSLFIGETEIASIGDALSQIATAAGGGQAGDGQPLGDQPANDGPGDAPTQPDFDDLGTAEAPKGPLGGDFDDVEPPADDPVVPDEEIPAPPEPEVNTGPTAIDDFNNVSEDGEGGDGEGGGVELLGPELLAPELDVTTTSDGDTLVNNILGSGIQVVPGSIVYTGAGVASGTFVGGVAAGIGIESGILLTSGIAEGAEGPNNSDGFTGSNGTPGDADLDALIPQSTNDAASLQFDFISDGGDLFFSYVFGSDEYNEYVDSSFNDVFAFFLDGENIALIPGTNTAVSINNVNGGSNSEYYNNNDPSDGGPFFNIEYDGFTDVFTVSVIGLAPGEHTIKLSIADAGDSSLDSGVFIQSGSFSDQPDGGEGGKGFDFAGGNVITGDGQPDSVPDSDPESDPLVVVQVTDGTDFGSGDTEGNGSDPIGNVVVNGVYGDLFISSNGSYTYNLNNGDEDVQALGEGETLNDVFTYTISDGNGGSDSATLTIHICGTNDAPVVNADTNWAQEDVADASGNVLQDINHAGAPSGAFADVEDTDIDANDVLTVQSIDGEANDANDVTGTYGSLDWAADGGYSYALDNGNGTVQALGEGETLTDQFTYTVTDGDVTDTATLTITIFGTNDGPGAQADTNWAKEDSDDASGNVLQDIDHAGAPSGSFADVEDTDPDADPLTVASIDGEANDANDVTGTYGSLDWAENGSYSYTLDNGNGTVQALDDGETLTDQFTYTMTDGGNTDTATLTITIFGTNDAPVVNADTNWAKEDSDDASGNVLQDINHAGAPSGAFADVADTDVDDTLTVQSIDGEANDANDVTGTYGSLDWAADGGYSYALDNGNGTVQALDDGETLTDQFTYTVTDGDVTDTATLTITIFGTNDAPVVNADTNWAKEDSSDASGNVLQDINHAGAPSGAFADVADTDVDDTLTVQSIDGEANDANDVTGTYGSLDWAADGGYSYALDNGNGTVQALGEGETLTDQFTYTVTDGDVTDTATLTITIFGTNDGPVAAPDQHLWVPSAFDDQAPEFSSPGGYPILIPLPTDVDGDPLTVTFTGVSDGSLDGQVGFYDGGFNPIIDGVIYDAAVLANLVYIPTDINDPLDDFDDQSFTYTVSDGDATDSSTVTLHEVQHNDEPGLQAVIGNGSSPLTSGNDQEGDVVLSQEFVDVLNGNGGSATFTLLTDYQEAPFVIPIPTDERGLFDSTNPLVAADGSDFGYDSDGDGDPDIFFDEGGAPDNDNAAVDRETEVSVSVTLIGASVILTGTTASDGTYDAIFSLVEEDDTNADGTADDLDVTWVYDPVTGLMTTQVDFGDAILVDSNGDPLLDSNDQTISLTEYLNASTPTDGVDNDGYVASSGDTWTFIYFDNDGGNMQARFVQIDMTFDNPGDLGITVEGTEIVDVIYGTPDAGDTLNGLGGNDIIDGRGGDDTINGGAGDDVIDGGAGNDTFVYDGSSDVAGSIDTILLFDAADDTFDFSGLAGDIGDVTFGTSGDGDIVVEFNGDSIAELDGITGAASVTGGSTIDEVALTIV